MPRFDRVLATLVLVSIAGLFVFTAQSGNAFTTYLIPLVLICGWRHYGVDLRALVRDPLFVTLLTLLLYLGASAAWSPGAVWLDVLKAQSRILFVVAYVTATAILALRYPAFPMWSAVAITTTAALAALLAAAFGNVDRGRLIAWGDLDRPVMAGLAWGAASLLAICLTFRSAPTTRLTVSLRRAFGLTAALLTFVAMLWSGSRSAWIGWISGAAVLSVLVAARPRVTSFGWLLALAAAAVWVVADPALTSTLLPRGDSFRPEIWQSTLDAVVHGSWLFGTGMLAHYTMIESGYPIAHPHSVYLATLFHGGLIAVVLLAGLVIGTFVRALRARGLWTTYATAALLAFAIPSIALDGGTLIDKVGYLWLLLWTPIGWSIGTSLRTSRPSSY